MEHFKQNNIIIFAILGLIALVFVVKTQSPISVELSDAQENDRIVVQGSAERLVAPDTASVTFSMTRKDASLSVATESVNKRIGEMLEEMKQFDVEEQDIKTTNYSVNPEYNYNREDGQRTFSGYRVNQSLKLTIRDLDQVGPVMTAIAEFKVDNVSGLNFFIDKDKEIREELRVEAIVDAKQKAKKLSRELGVDLDVIVGFYENNNGGGYYPQTFARAQFAEEAYDSTPASIPTGENKLQANVSVTYKITN